MFNLENDCNVRSSHVKFQLNLSNVRNVTNLASLENLGNVRNFENVGNVSNVTNLANLENLGNVRNVRNVGNVGAGVVSDCSGILNEFITFFLKATDEGTVGFCDSINCPGWG